jgi:hypothetical protein
MVTPPKRSRGPPARQCGSAPDGGPFGIQPVKASVGGAVMASVRRNTG